MGWEWNWDNAKRVWAEESIEIEIEKITESMSKRGLPAEDIAEYTKIDEKQVYEKVMEASLKECIIEKVTVEDFNHENDLMSAMLHQFGTEKMREIYYNTGEKYAKEAVAERMLLLGIPIDIIIEDTELIEERIIELKKGLNLYDWCDGMNENVKYWLDIADYDIETARAMLKTGRYLYVGFMCHQTIEKALKAVVARDCAEGEMPPKTHDLTKLAIQSNLLDLMSEEQKNFIEDLNPLNIESRYPEYKNQIAAGLTKEICAELIKGTEELLCWIKEQL